MKKIAIFNLFLFLFPGLFSQSLEKKIPSSSGYVIGVNLKSISQKLNLNDLSSFSFLRKKDQTSSIDPANAMKELFRIPEKAGINIQGRLFLYSDHTDSLQNISFLIPLSNQDKFIQRMKEILKSPAVKPEFKKEGKFKTLVYDHRLVIRTAKDFTLISIFSPVFYYADDYYEYNGARQKVITAIDSIRYASPDTAVENEVVPIPDVIDVVPEVIGDTVASYETYPVEESYESSYENDSLMKQFERNWEAGRKKKENLFFQVREKKLIKHQKFIAELSPAATLWSEAGFRDIFSRTDDLIYWFNYSGYSKDIIDAVTDKYFHRFSYDTAYYNWINKNKPKNSLEEMFSNWTFYGLGNFNQGELNMKFYNHFNDTMGPMIRQMYKGDINPEFFRYIRKENLIGLVGVSVDAEAIARFYYEIFRRALQSTPFPNRYMMAGVEMTDLFLDKKVLYHTFRGDGVLAFTGMKNKLRTYTSYEYDSINFENRTVLKTKTDYVPEFVTVLTIENQENLRRIIQLIGNLNGLRELGKDVWILNTRKREIDSNFFMSIRNDLFFITNDRNLVMSGFDVETGKMTGDAFRDYYKNTSFGFWNASEMFRQMGTGSGEKNSDSEIWLKLSNIINSCFFEAKPVDGNVASYEVRMEMKNRQDSSLLELVNLLEAFYNLKLIK